MPKARFRLGKSPFQKKRSKRLKSGFKNLKRIAQKAGSKLWGKG